MNEAESIREYSTGEKHTHTEQAFTGTSSQEALSGSAKWVRLCADQDCYIKFGQTGTVAAAATSLRLPMNTVDYVPAAGFKQLAVIRQTADGTLNITEIE